jgi:hypothetical protein
LKTILRKIKASVGFSRKESYALGDYTRMFGQAVDEDLFDN